jgi:hypothetical protein
VIQVIRKAKKEKRAAAGAYAVIQVIRKVKREARETGSRLQGLAAAAAAVLWA